MSKWKLFSPKEPRDKDDHPERLPLPTNSPMLPPANPGGETLEDVLLDPNSADLEAKGTPIGPLDTLIAAHAKSLNYILVTNNNEKEFSRVNGLQIENWVK